MFTWIREHDDVGCHPPNTILEPSVGSVAGLVILASGRLVQVDILKLSEFPWPGVGTCHTSIGLGWQRMVTWPWEWLRGEKLSFHLMTNDGEGVTGLNLSYDQSLSESGCILSNWSQYRLGIAQTLSTDHQKYSPFLFLLFLGQDKTRISTLLSI